MTDIGRLYEVLRAVGEAGGHVRVDLGVGRVFIVGGPVHQGERARLLAQLRGVKPVLLEFLSNGPLTRWDQSLLWPRAVWEDYARSVTSDPPRSLEDPAIYERFRVHNVIRFEPEPRRSIAHPEQAT